MFIKSISNKNQNEMIRDLAMECKIIDRRGGKMNYSIFYSFAEENDKNWEEFNSEDKDRLIETLYINVDRIRNEKR